LGVAIVVGSRGTTGHLTILIPHDGALIAVVESIPALIGWILGIAVGVLLAGLIQIVMCGPFFSASVVA
jgi:hypothetical protein